MTYEKQLDGALEYLRDHIAPQGTFLYYDKFKADHNRQEHYLYKHLKERGIEEHLWLPMVYFLKEDDYIDLAYDPPEDEIKKRPPNQLKITLKGLMFISNGGYSEMKRLRIEKETNLHESAIRMETYTKRLSTWTERLTYGTVIAALILVSWEMIKTFWIEGHPFPFCH